MTQGELIQLILATAALFGLFLFLMIHRAVRRATDGSQRSESLMDRIPVTEKQVREMVDRGQLTQEEAEKIRRRVAEKTRQLAAERERNAPKPGDPIAAAIEEARRDAVAPPRRPQPVAAEAAPSLPTALQPMLQKSMMELDELRLAGFLTESEMQAIQAAKAAQRK